jgi:hypothetical protein
MKHEAVPAADALPAADMLCSLLICFTLSPITYTHQRHIHQQGMLGAHHSNSTSGLYVHIHTHTHTHTHTAAAAAGGGGFLAGLFGSRKGGFPAATPKAPPGGVEWDLGHLAMTYTVCVCVRERGSEGGRKEERERARERVFICIAGLVCMSMRVCTRT